MVLEALAAVGLAGNICQFVDFTGQLLRTATSIYQSQIGATQDSETLRDVSQSLQELCENLVNSINHAQAPAHAARPSLIKLATDCTTAAQGLILEIDNIRSKKPDSKWHSFKAALLTTWKRRHIKAMEQQLELFRSQLILELQILQSGRWSDVNVLLEDWHDQHQLFTQELNKHVFKLTNEIKTAQDNLNSQLSFMVSQRWHTQLSPANPDIVEEEASLSPRIAPLIQEEVITSLSHLAVLESLKFDQMQFRHSKIQDAHPRTFEWMFSNHFQSWLLSDEPIYWISGKPGSGKSTLMKYLAENNNTRASLLQWSGTRHLIVTSYFFWVNGTEMQRSQEGLLQSLLHEIFQQHPVLVKDVVPQLWQQLRVAVRERTTPITWSRKMLLAAFKRLSTLKIDTSFCMFIDGLDEYEGDYDDLNRTINYLTRLRFKICVASRPWNVFRDTYGHRAHCRLFLEELNKPDIECYVQDHLGKRVDFKSLEATNRQASEILDEIVQRSQGVFLWVHLVVRSLVEGLRNGDRMSQLHERLRSLPGDLEDFFRHIFLSLDTFYRRQLAHMFQVTLARLEPLSPLAYWYLDEHEDDPTMALSMPCQASSPDKIYKQMIGIRRRIDGRSKGLLEVTPPIVVGNYNSRVDFLHRTVRDFFMTTEMQVMLKNHQEKGFNADLAICRALLAELKVTATMSSIDAPRTIVARPLHCFFHAAKSLEKNHKESPIPYLDEIERVIDQHIGCHPQRTPVYPWSDFNCVSFTDVTIANNLQIYLKQRLNQEAQTISMEAKISLLNLVLGKKRLNMDILTMILSVGPSPVLFDAKMQDDLATQLKAEQGYTIAQAMRIISSYSRLERSLKDRQAPASEMLREILATNPSSVQLQYAVEPKRFSRERLRRKLSNRWWQLKHW